LSELSGLFGKYISERLLAPSQQGAHSRQRVYALSSTFWAFLSQALSPQVSCREVVRKLQSYCSQQGLRLPGSSTSAYCQARGRLPLQRLEAIHQEVCEELQGRVQEGWLWLSRRVRVVDGTGIRLNDTAQNQAAYPQPAAQRAGCGFPVMQVVACFCLHSGALIDWVSTKLTCHESVLLPQLLGVFEPGDVVLGDRGFCSYANLALSLQRGIDAVMRLHQRRPHDLRGGRRLGKEDRLVTWTRPKNPGHMSEQLWHELAESIQVRLVRVCISIPGFRVRQVWIATTLTDPAKYPKEALAQLYRRRWSAELWLRDIKTSMGIEQLRARTPAMVHKELCTFAIAYNLLRLLMVQSAICYHLEPSQISFKATADSLRQFRSALRACLGRPGRTSYIIEQLLLVIARERVADRPDRVEPRAVKLRPKNYQLLTRPRKFMRVAPSRKNKGQYHPKPALS
jgi:hypothetical protein